MQRTITIAVIALATVAAAVAVWFWALRPLGFASYLNSTGASDADIIRQYWPHHFVQPEWVSPTPGRIMNWHTTETCARLTVVAVSWLFTAGGFLYGFVGRQRLRPNTILEPTRTGALGSPRVCGFSCVVDPCGSAFER